MAEIPYFQLLLPLVVVGLLDTSLAVPLVVLVVVVVLVEQVVPVIRPQLRLPKVTMVLTVNQSTVLVVAVVVLAPPDLIATVELVPLLALPALRLRVPAVAVRVQQLPEVYREQVEPAVAVMVVRQDKPEM
jgi:hypothetical protein